MVDVQSPQQALRAYSSAKEYACGILCDARCGESNRGGNPYRPASGAHRRARSRLRGNTGMALPQNHSHPTESTGAGRPTPGRDESRLGHNPISTLRDLRPPRFRDMPHPHHSRRLAGARYTVPGQQLRGEQLLAPP